MSSTQPQHEGHAPDSPADVRALPARPSLEFERKQAKKLLAQIRRGNADALARVHAKLKGSSDRKPEGFKLADAQFSIAREYGFTSWPRLVKYLEVLARHQVSGQGEGGPGSGESMMRHIASEFDRKRPWTAAAIARFVPRFYGRTATEIFASEVTTDDLRLVAVRINRFPSWEAMSSSSPRRRDRWVRDESPFGRAYRAIKARDLRTLQSLIRAHPELLQVTNGAEPWASSIVYSVVHSEMRSSLEEGRELSQWLVSTGLDLTQALNWLLLGFMRMKPTDTQWLLDHGADPEWMPPNGISVLEHAIYRYWNGEAVDLVARRVKPREALWIAAGVGDSNAVRRYFDKSGRLTDAARQNRPDFTAMGPFPAPPTFGDSDLDVMWEAFLVAGWNDRYPVLDVLLANGFPLDYASWGQSLIRFGIFEGRVSLIEHLVKHGADLDTRGYHPNTNAREAAEEHFAQRPDDPARRRILELCGGRPAETVIREHEERRDRRVMQTVPQVEKAFVYAKQDALRAGLTAVSPENLFIGILREDGLPVYPLIAAGVDLPTLRSALGQRFETTGDPPAEMTGDAECTAILMAARKEAELRKHGYLTPVHVFYALMQRPPESVLDLMRSAGGDRDKVIVETEKLFAGMH
jgi:hypothetical protein